MSNPKQVECCGTCAYISNNCIKGTHPKGHAINVNIFDAPCKDYISCKNRESIPKVEPSLPKFQVGQKVVTKNGHIYTVEQVTKGTCDNNFWYVIIDGDPLSRDCVTEADLIAEEIKQTLPKFQVGQKVYRINKGGLWTVLDVDKKAVYKQSTVIMYLVQCLDSVWVFENELSVVPYIQAEPTPEATTCEKEIKFTGIYAEAFDLLCNKPNKIADMLAQAKTEPSIEQRLAEIERKINILFKV